ncbi:MAG: beta-methylgalactoside transporter [Clostridiales bacterium]|nr:beta-methylgalactoside transporter [Clostridiales bacterium]
MIEKKNKKQSGISTRVAAYRALPGKEKGAAIGNAFLSNAMYIIIICAIIVIAILRPQFISLSSLVNIVSLTAAKLPIALGIAGCIVLTGTDISAGRTVGLTACIAASLSLTVNKLFPNLGIVPLPVVILAVLGVGAAVGLVNGFSVAKFKLHPFIVTLSTQLIVYGIILLYLKLGTNNGQTLSGLSDTYRNFVAGPLFNIPTGGGNSITVPRYVLYAVILTVIMWIIWNKTTFGKNMFAVGSNEEAANVSGVNVTRTIILVFVIAGMMYGITGFIDGARIASVNANTGLNYECDAIAACVIGGVSFVGGIGKISGIVIGVLLLQIIFVGLNFLSVDQNLLYIVKGLIILVACAIDMRKYLVRK